jgi:hypothetical protein
VEVRSGVLGDRLEWKDFSHLYWGFHDAVDTQYPGADRVGREVYGELLEGGGIEEGKWGGEAKHYLAGGFEGSIRFAHSHGADSV